MSADNGANELILPVRGFGDGDLPARLRRQFRAIEDWANTPHRVFGSRMISPLFYGEDNTSHAFTAQPSGTAFTGEGTDVFTLVTVELDRRTLAFVWGVAEFDNTDAATDYAGLFFCPVDVGGTRKNGKAMREYQVHGSPGKEVVSNIRKAYIDISTKTTVKFQMGWKVSDAAAQDMTIYRQRLIVGLFDAPDMDANGTISWTNFQTTKNAYTTQEGDES